LLPQQRRTTHDHLLAAPSDDTPLIQQLHITAGHAICEIVEPNLFRA
jgi:D-sedoheptulose 7-phosphate isomerase